MYIFCEEVWLQIQTKIADRYIDRSKTKRAGYKNWQKFVYLDICCLHKGE